MNINRKKTEYLLAIILGVISTFVYFDLRYAFGNYDTPFFIACGMYVFSIVLLRLTSRLTIGIVVLLITSMAIHYMLYGPVRLTERLGEWFFLFLCIGIVQYSFETFFR